MKNTMLAVFGGLLLLSSCQKNDALSPAVNTVNAASVPQAVVSSLRTAFPTATQTVWNKTALTTYAATFKLSSSARTATFQSNGAMLRTGTVIDAATLPTAITDYLKANYAGYTIVQAETKTDASGAITGYETRITVGTTQYELEFNAVGVFTKLETPDGHAEANGIAQTALLPAITTYLTTNYAGYTFHEAEARLTNGVVSGYQVEIVQNNLKYNVLFDATGKFVSVSAGGNGGGGENHGNGGGDNHGTATAQKDLPAPVGTYLDANYKGYAFLSATTATDNAGKVTGYEVSFSLSNKNYEAQFDATGAFISIH